MTTVPRFAALDAPAHWRTVDFISDLHLKPEEPGTFDAWSDYMGRTPADAVFILGDLFEAWVGDDAATTGSFEDRCGGVLHTASARAALFFMHGNRDFLLGADFLARCGMQALADPTVFSFGDQRYLLTHGDLLCTDDVDYQRFRRQVRNDDWQQAFLARPLAERQALARQMRAQSEQHQAAQAVYADVDAALARRWLHEAEASTLIHGHTHRPGEQRLDISGDNQRLMQVVLSDWHVTASERRAQVLRLTADGWQRLSPEDAC